MNTLGEAESAKATKVEIKRHKFDDEDEIDLDNLDLWRNVFYDKLII